MPQPLRSPDSVPRSRTRPILPPRINERTHVEVAQAYVDMGLLDEALFELTLVSDDPDAVREARKLREAIRLRKPPSRPLRTAPQPPPGPPTRVDGLAGRSRVIEAKMGRPVGDIDDAIDRAFDDCFGEESPTTRDNLKVG
jgi:hypothetical protein